LSVTSIFIAVLLRRDEVRRRRGDLHVLDVPPEDAAAEDHPAEAAGGVRTAGEPEDVDPVAGLEALAQLAIPVLDLVEQAPAERAAAHLLSGVGADARKIFADLVGVIGERLVELAHVRLRFHSLIFLARLVPSAVHA